MDMRARHARRGTNVAPADDGFTMVEVIVSFVLFMILAATAGMALTSVLKTSASNEDRVVAANLVARQIETIEGQTADQIVDGDAPTRTAVIDGRTFYIDQTSTLDTVGGTGSACAGASGPAGFKRVTVSVRWNRMEGVTPVHSDTIKALGVLGLTGGNGVLAVPVQDDAGKGVAGVPVTVGSLTRTTGSDGCAVFPSLAPRTDYVATASASGYVGKDSEASVSSGALTVLAGQVTKAPPLLYNQAATAVLVPTVAPGYTAPPALGYTVAGTLISGGYKTMLPCSGAPAANCVYNDGSNPRIGWLFPLTSGYQVWPGICATARTSTAPSIMTLPGQVVTGQLPEFGYANVVVRNGTSTQLAGYTIAAANRDCPSEYYVTGLTSGDTEAVKLALPAGNWRLQASQGATVAGTADLAVVSGQVVGAGTAVAVSVP